MDTYKYLTSNLKKDRAKTNVENILSSAPLLYTELEKEKGNVIANESGEFKRVFKLFSVTNISIPQNKPKSDFCFNLFVRPDNESFIVIGKTPKGKIKKSKQNESVVLETKSTKSSETPWETVDFE